MRLAATLATSLVLAFFASAGVAADKPHETWDGLVQVKAKRVDLAFLAPGADFRPYTKFMVDPTHVAFHKDWMRNVNDRRDLGRMIDDERAQEILEAARTNFADVFREAFSKAGYTTVDEPGPDVLRVKPGVINLYINAPDVMAPGRSRIYTANAGEATMILELRDSQTNALLARVLDRRETHDSIGPQRVSSVTNAADFHLLFKSWANICVRGMQTLKEVSPVPQTLRPKQKL